MELRNTKQLFDEAEHDMMYYQNRGLPNLPKPKAKADKKDRGSIIHDIMRNQIK